MLDRCRANRILAGVAEENPISVGLENVQHKSDLRLEPFDNKIILRPALHRQLGQMLRHVGVPLRG
jgi:hypothetical protein